MVTSAGAASGLLGPRTLRILFYTDCRDSNWSEVPQPGPNGASHLRGQPTEFGLRIAKDLLEAQSGYFVRFKVDVINRHHDHEASGAIQDFAGTPRVGKHKLTPALLKHYHQVWFFGQLYANYDTDNLATLQGWGNRESELTDAEVAALKTWMDAGGGVLITGDHSNDVHIVEASLADPSLRGKQLNLGRAIGHRVPRAGQMRVWIGDPGAFRTTNYAVDTANDSDDMVLMSKQEDATPQSIRVAKVGHRVGLGRVASQFFFEDFHPLFKASPNAAYPRSVIDILPDHVHEGAVAFPASFPDDVWPRHNGVQPKPQPIAWGTNWAVRNRGFFRDLGSATEVFRLNPEVVEVSAYDGDLAGVGRIVAHSTWHHFVNVNLVGFRKPDATPGPVLDRIGTYYANLALWLSPQHERSSVIFDATKWIREHPLVREVHGGPPPLVGATAAQVLTKELGDGPFADLMQLSLANVPIVDRSREGESMEVSLPHDLILGHAIQMLNEEALNIGRNTDKANGKAGQLNASNLLQGAAVRAARTMQHSLLAAAKALDRTISGLD